MNISQRQRRGPQCNHPPTNTSTQRQSSSLEPQSKYLTFSRSQKYTSFSQGKSRAKPIVSILLEVQDSRSEGHRLGLNPRTCEKVSSIANLYIVLFHPRPLIAVKVCWYNTTPTGGRAMVLVWLYLVWMCFMDNLQLDKTKASTREGLLQHSFSTTLNSHFHIDLTFNALWSHHYVRVC